MLADEVTDVVGAVVMLSDGTSPPVVDFAALPSSRDDDGLSPACAEAIRACARRASLAPVPDDATAGRSAVTGECSTGRRASATIAETEGVTAVAVVAAAVVGCRVAGVFVGTLAVVRCAADVAGT